MGSVGIKVFGTHVGLMTKLQLSAMAEKLSPTSIQAYTKTSSTLLVSINFNLEDVSAFLVTAPISFRIYFVESSGNADADHNLDLSLGNSNPKHGSNLRLRDNGNHNAATGPHSTPLQSEADWQSRGLVPKVDHLSNDMISV